MKLIVQEFNFLSSDFLCRVYQTKVDFTQIVIALVKKVLFTCILGDYDDLVEPTFITDGWDYIVFTDNPDLQTNIWQKKIVNRQFDDAKRDVCNIKINCFDFLEMRNANTYSTSNFESASNT